MNRLGSLGQYGGRVLRSFDGGTRLYRAGDVLSGEVILSWPPLNRKSLASQGLMEYFPAPAEAKQGAEENATEEEFENVSEHSTENTGRRSRGRPRIRR